MTKAVIGLILSCCLVGRVQGQSWRVRFESSVQRVAFRGLTADSIRQDQATTGPTGGAVSPEGFAVTCGFDEYCRFFRPGQVQRGIPAYASTDLTMWGLGVQGLSVRVSARAVGDLTGDRIWPGTSPTVRLVEGYAEYVRGGFTGRAGRFLEIGRLGSSGGGIDGGRASWSFDRLGLEAAGYLGWGFARGTILSITSPAVNPLADYQPGQRQIVAGALARIHRTGLDARIEYRREVDPETDYFVSERAGLSLAVAPGRGLRVSGGTERDMAQGRWGTSDITVTYSGRDAWVTAGARHYQPFFDLWTVWGVFSPVGYDGFSGSLAGRPFRALLLRGGAEWFRYQETETNTPQVPLRDRGWRWSGEANFAANDHWTLEARIHDERRPGASSQGVDGSVRWRPTASIDLAVSGGTLARPLELRFQDAGITWIGATADWRSGERWRLGVGVDRYWDSRDRPDAASFDWNQWRLSARVALTLRSDADRWVLPPARSRPELP